MKTIQILAKDATSWHVSGSEKTRDRRLLRIVDANEEVKALVPVPANEDGAGNASQEALMLARAGAMFLTLQAILAWNERQAPDKRLSKRLHNRLVVLVAQAKGNA